MIDIVDKKDCVGCNACVQLCPKQCITMHEDEQGFLYPFVDLNLCINCHLCEKVCPVINQADPREPLETFAGENPDDKVRMLSSSGGIFYALAKTIIDEGGVVFGAKFNEQWEVVHDYAETLEGIKSFQGSKYVQSRIGNTFRQAEAFLKAGRKVMFTGTPCQIAALGLFLHKDYDEQLLKVDVVCHGVPSPLVWREYLRYITRPKGASVGKNTDSQSTLENVEMPEISGVFFRDKRISWEKYGFAVHTVARQGDQNSDSQSCNNSSMIYDNHNENPYFWAFNSDLTLRPSCFACPAKSGKSCSHLTIGDFWHVETVFPDIDKNLGISLILLHDISLMPVLDKYLSIRQTNYKEAIRCVKSIAFSEKEPLSYQKFWKSYQECGVSTLVKFFNKYRFTIRQKIIINPTKKILGEYLTEKIKKILRK